jgi:vacuolar-type H+-ATPase subunit E/Vma4
MSQKELLEAISQQALIQTEKVAADAEESAASIIHRAESEISDIKDTVIDKARRSVASEEARIVNEARLESKKGMLAAKHELVDKVMAALRKSLEDLSRSKDYGKILNKLLKESLEGLEGQVTIRCRDEDRTMVEEAAAKAGLDVVLEKSDSTLGGIDVLWGDDRFIRHDTFESRLEKLFPVLLSEANRLLFAGKGA